MKKPFRKTGVEDVYLCTKYHGFDVVWAQVVDALYPEADVYAEVLSIPALLAARSGLEMRNPELRSWAEDIRKHLSELMESPDYDLMTVGYIDFLIEESVQQLKESNVK